MITIPVGKTEKHTVTFSYDTMFGKVKIMLDDKEYSTSRVILVGHTPFTLQVGEKEKHNVRIELDNQLYFAFRGSDVKVFIDDELVQQNRIKANGVAFILALTMTFIVFLCLWILSMR